MSSKPLVGDKQLLLLNRKIQRNFSRSKAVKLGMFASQYLSSTARAELDKQSNEEIYAGLIAAWDFIQQRPSKAPKIEFTHTRPKKGKPGSATTTVHILLDDMPFLVDSMRQSLLRSNTTIYSVNNAVLHIQRRTKARGAATVFKNLSAERVPEHHSEALSSISCARIDDSDCKAVEKELRDTLKNVAIAVKDFPAMLNQASAIHSSLQSNAENLPVSNSELQESLKFISWLIDNHFTFLGYEQYRISRRGGKSIIELQKNSLLGVARYKPGIRHRTDIASLRKGAGELILKKQICSFAKSSARSKVHRPAYYDYVLLKEFDASGNVITEHRFLGLYTSAVYFREALDIPLIRKKVRSVLDKSGFVENGHNMKDLLLVINQLPRDELFQVSNSQLLKTAIEITRIQSSRNSRLFIRKDLYGKFFSCLVYVPRDIFTTKVQLDIQRLLQQRLRGEELEFSVHSSESTFTRIHFILRVPDIEKVKYKLSEIETEMVALIKPWEDSFSDVLRTQYLESQARELFATYSGCFSSAYKEAYLPKLAVKDIADIEQVAKTKAVTVKLTRCASEAGAEFSCKIFSYSQQLYLSDVAPILENLGLNIISEKAFSLQLNSQDRVWLHDFSLYRKRPLGSFSDESKKIFEEAFTAIWDQQVDDDKFNELVTTAEIVWRDAVLLRAYAAYLKQIQFGYSVAYIAETLSSHRNLCRLLIQYFKQRFDPKNSSSERKSAAKTRAKLVAGIDSVTILSEDSVLRAYLNLLDSTLRTNFFQADPLSGEAKSYVSFKFDPQLIQGVPLPRPKFEIFVFSRRVEGVHLRGGKVARGGLRWSDRREDYRTEILGLVKAQQVKNSVIVPVGAKGGFVVKQEPATASREDFMRLGVECYQTFIRGLLDITDNLVDGKLVPPTSVLRSDDDDPYLVVAADKGTATFSDIANAIAAEYNFWLGDGFASGGSNGYDHKQMGITARGAWISVQRHFRELDIDVQKQDFTVVGIGDMSGDVFGNGMLLSRHICLVAAFNHRYIFIDPAPDAARSHVERSRLFRKAGSSWSDYNVKLISKGGGIFPRQAKSVAISPQMKALFDINQDQLTPDQLISKILLSPVDLIWNGGIGTYVKASSENHSDVGDKANDNLRVDGRDLRCRVIGEGGNLGCTQLARIEYAMSGGVSLTDFIDNSAGVDCSDHEVNIKILLNELSQKQGFSQLKRSSLLKSMTDEVSALVLRNNYQQVQAIGFAYSEVEMRNKEYADLISYLENNAGLIRELEFLPNHEQVEERSAKQQHLTRPEIAVLTSYMKMYLKQELVSAIYIDDEYLQDNLFDAFPGKLKRSYKKELLQHPLRREIIAMQLANSLINLVGPSFVYRMVDSTGASPAEVVQAAIVVRDSFQIEKLCAQIEALDYKVPTRIQNEMMSNLTRLLRRATRWLLRSQRIKLGFASANAAFLQKVGIIRKLIPAKLPPDFQATFHGKRQYLTASGVPEKLATELSQCEFLFPAASLIQISNDTGEKLPSIVDVYYTIGEELQLNWLGKMINQLPVSSNWQALARETYLDDLSWQQHALSKNIVVTVPSAASASNRVALWSQQNRDYLKRARTMVAQLQSEAKPDYSMFSVVLRELHSLADSTVAAK